MPRSTDTGCLMNIGGRLHRENKPLEVLHIAYLARPPLIVVVRSADQSSSKINPTQIYLLFRPADRGAISDIPRRFTTVGRSVKLTD